METLENRLQKRMHVSLYALLFLTVLLGLSILLESCSGSHNKGYTYQQQQFRSCIEFKRSQASLLIFEKKLTAFSNNGCSHI
ncbi:MAG TPA: hypothetical protein VD884_14825 [Ohtaekwangia sp.]|nr:hypothetical protein [Ohtaekwangia sp.]